MEMVIGLLKAIQEKEKLSDRQFASRLGLARNSSWNRIKNGKVPVSDKLLVRAHRAFPELGIFLSENAINHGSDASPDGTEHPLGQILSGLWQRVRGFFTKNRE